MTACALATIAACLLVFSAAAQNVGYAYALGLATSAVMAYVLAAASLGASLLGPCAWMAVFSRGVGIGRRMVALVMGVGCLAYAATCSLGQVHGSRTSGISATSTAADTYADGRALKRAAIAELATLKGQAENTLKRRRELMAIIAAPTPTKAVQPGAGDAQASAVGYWLRLAGYRTSDSDVGVWLSAAMVMFLELAAALSLTVAHALRPARSEAPPAAVPPQPAVVAAKDEAPASAQETRPTDDDKGDAPPPPKPRGKGKAGRPAAVDTADAIERLRQVGGRAAGSVAGVGRVLGTKSRTTTRRLLNRLAAAGQVRLTSTAQGVSVALV